MRLLVVHSALCLLVGASRLWAADLYVAQNGQTPAPPYATWETAAAQIQDAVNVAGLNDTVWVGPGRYGKPPGAVVHGGTNIVYITLPMRLQASGAREETIIDGEGKYRGVMIYYPANSTDRFIIDGFTISN